MWQLSMYYIFTHNYLIRQYFKLFFRLSNYFKESKRRTLVYYSCSYIYCHYCSIFIPYVLSFLVKITSSPPIMALVLNPCMPNSLSDTYHATWISLKYFTSHSQSGISKAPVSLPKVMGLSSKLHYFSMNLPFLKALWLYIATVGFFVSNTWLWTFSELGLCFTKVLIQYLKHSWGTINV